MHINPKIATKQRVCMRVRMRLLDRENMRECEREEFSWAHVHMHICNVMYENQTKDQPRYKKNMKKGQQRG